MKNKPLNVLLSGLFLLILLLNAGCADFFRGTTRIIAGTYDTPTPYITPATGGLPHNIVTPFPQGTPVFDTEKCLTVAGNDYLLNAEILYYTFKGLHKKANETSREDLPPIIDEIREIHEELQGLDPPSDCEMFLALDYAYKAEIDQTIRGFVAYRNLEDDEVWLDFFNEGMFFNAVVSELLDRIF